MKTNVSIHAPPENDFLTRMQKCVPPAVEMGDACLRSFKDFLKWASVEHHLLQTNFIFPVRDS